MMAEAVDHQEEPVEVFDASDMAAERYGVGHSGDMSPFVQETAGDQTRPRWQRQRRGELQAAIINGRFRESTSIQTQRGYEHGLLVCSASLASGSKGCTRR